jgi:hypothetical protein
MKILARLDDLTPNRNVVRWKQIEQILDRLGIRPLVACVPDDKYFGSGPTTGAFWEDVRGLHRKGWEIALHGETHEVTTIAAGVNHEVFFADKSEFVGLSEEAQLGKLTRAWNLFAEQGIEPRVFVAPNHGFDANTVRAVRRHGAMGWISDGISWRVFRDRDLVWLPQLDWRVPRLGFGFRTVCLHPCTMSDSDIAHFAEAAAAVKHSFTSVDEIDHQKVRPRGTADFLFEKAFTAWLRTKVALYRRVSRHD